MRWNCSNFPPVPVEDPVFYITNVLIIPTIFGVGVVGNLLLLLLVNRAQLRVQSPAYVYVTGVAVVDLIRLFLTLPSCLRDMGALSPSLSYAKNMVLFSNIVYAVNSICRHAAIWLTTSGLVVLLCVLANPWRKTRAVRITTSRMVAFILILFCIMIDFPRFFELELNQFEGPCFAEMNVWTWEFTKLGEERMYGAIYYWLTNVLCEIVPLLTIVVTGIVIWIKFPPSSRDKDEQLTLAMLMCGFLLTVLELPAVVAHVYYSATENGFRRDKEFQTLALIAQCFSLLRCVVSFIIFTIISAPFRKAFRRTFCCSCITGDDYYEPLTCNCFSPKIKNEQLKDSTDAKEKKDRSKHDKDKDKRKDKNEKKPKKEKQKKKKKDDSDVDSIEKEPDTSDTRIIPPEVIIVPPSPKKESQWI